MFSQGVLFKITVPNQFSQDSQQGKAENSTSVFTCSCASAQVNTHKGDGFNFGELNKFMLNNLNMSVVNNPLLEVYNSLVDSYRKGKVYRFGEMQLEKENFNLSEDAEKTFGKYVEPEMFKYFNICGEILQTQRRWWRSGLLFSEQSTNIARIFEQQSKECRK